MVEFLAVAALGGLGAVLRYLLGRWNGTLPWGILLANTMASCVAGFAAGTTMSLALVTGLAGGLSTFSTLIAQTAGLWTRNKRSAVLNLALNIVIPSTAAAAFGLLAVALLK